MHYNWSEKLSITQASMTEIGREFQSCIVHKKGTITYIKNKVLKKVHDIKTGNLCFALFQ